MVGQVYLAAALAAGLMLVMAAADLFNTKLIRARSFMYVAIIYLFIILVFLVSDKT